MKTKMNYKQQPKQNKVLGLYTVFMVSLSISYIVTKLIQHIN